MQYPIIKITTPLHMIVYLQGKKFAEGYDINYIKWIQLGMIMMQFGLNFNHIHRVFIGHDDGENRLIHSNLYDEYLTG